LNVNVANDGCCTRKEEVTAWLKVLMVMHMEAIHMKEQQEGEMLNKRLVKEAW
jgi:hypothetical protein